MLESQFFLATFGLPLFSQAKKIIGLTYGFGLHSPYIRTLFCLILAGRRPALEEESPLIKEDSHSLDPVRGNNRSGLLTK